MRHTNIYKKVMKWLSKFNVQYRWIDKNTYGIAFHDGKKTVILNLWLFLCETYIHECYHLENPEMSEKEVITNTSIAVQNLKDKEIIKIARTLLRR